MHLVVERLGRRVGDIGRQVGLTALPRPSRALELRLDGLHQPALVVSDHQVHAREATTFEPGEELQPRPLALAIPHLKSQHLAIPLLVDPGGDQRAHRPHPPRFTHLDHQRIHQYEGIATATHQVPLVPARHQRIEARTQIRDGGLGEARATQLRGEARHLARRDASDDQLHERQDQRLFAALVAREHLGRELPIPYLRNQQGERADPRGELARLVAIAVALPLLAAFVGS